MTFFFDDSATTEIYTLSLHDALPIWRPARIATQRSPEGVRSGALEGRRPVPLKPGRRRVVAPRSEEHTSELQSRLHLVCRLLLEKKKKRDGERPRGSEAALPNSPHRV